MKMRGWWPAILSGAMTLALGLSGCSGSPSDTHDTTAGASTPPGSSASSSASTSATGKQYTIGVAVIVSHPSLQLVQDGFEEVLKEQGVNYKLISENAQGDNANAATIASEFASNKSIDLILAISTPIALAMANAEKARPILFSAVTDPVGAGLVPSWDQAGPNVTGTSDMNPGAKPVQLVTQAMPAAKTIGVLYSSSEPNSLVQVSEYQKEAADLGVTLKVVAITSAAEVSVGLSSLEGVDALLIPTDNTVVASLATVIGWGQEKQIPVFSADADSVKQGTVATLGISYEDLGRRTGEMAVQILTQGVAISTIKPLAVTDTQLVVNPDAAKTFGLTLPDSLLAGATVVTTQS
jgi:putative ABC transport system substrate-binding protein